MAFIMTEVRSGGGIHSGQGEKHENLGQERDVSCRYIYIYSVIYRVRIYIYIYIRVIKNNTILRNLIWREITYTSIYNMCSYTNFV